MIKFIVILLTVILLSFGQDNLSLYYPEGLFTSKMPVQILPCDGFTLGYCYKYKQSAWTIYELNVEELKGNAKRRNKFRPDSNLVNHIVNPMDYFGSNYDKGHLVPCADFKYSQGSMDQTFLMTNMSPQKPSFNRGVWKRLERQCRKWTEEKESIYCEWACVYWE